MKTPQSMHIMARLVDSREVNVASFVVSSFLHSFFLVLILVASFSSCTHRHRAEVDALNAKAYSFHYRNLDSTLAYAQRAFDLSSNYGAGKAEALNHMAFVSIARMDYAEAYEQLKKVSKTTDSQIEKLVANIQFMRLCQRESHNKDFYQYRERARSGLHRIREEQSSLNQHEADRLVYAQSELAIVTSTYYYYVGLEQPSIDALLDIGLDELERDTAQYLNYLYNVGAGGIITQGNQSEINQQEFDYLLRCYLMALQYRYPFWQANSMQSISEHMLQPSARGQLIAENLPAMKFINVDDMPDSLLAGNLAEKALVMFQQYGDVYQTAGAYRTLAACYVAIDDYRSALICLRNALEQNPAIEQAPDLVASIREQLSVAYSAIDDKSNSDYNRNLYLDKQEQTRQDRQLEARAEQLETSSRQLNYMILAVLLAILIVAALLYVFDRLRRRGNRRNSIETLLQPLQEWKRESDIRISELNEKREEINEAYALNVIHIVNNKKRNLENRAKIFLVNSITPLIDRMIHEVDRLEHQQETPERRSERYEYISELCDKINEYNDVLTQWIQLRQGELSLHIESFPLQPLFDMMQKSRMSFVLKGIRLEVEPTTAVVKADRILTLFMINTIADNARKFTPSGGVVSIRSIEAENYVEVSIADTGRGMSDDEVAHVFKHQIQNSHGFGLMNCKGIIEKYHKISSVFNVCSINVESKLGKGSRFFFRLPKGIVRMAQILLLSLSASMPLSMMAADGSLDSLAASYADSAYYSNINGTYERTLQFADSVRKYMNAVYRQQVAQGVDTLLKVGSFSAESPEVRWFHDSLAVNYGVILDMRNESAVAALALHEWSLYRYNNKVYTQLFKETSADSSLDDYCRVMQRSETNKQVAIVILIMLLLLIFPAYYMLYYRHQLYYRFCLDRVCRINEILLSDASPEEQLQRVQPLTTETYPPVLQHVVDQIKDTLKESNDMNAVQNINIELAEDERRCAEYEDEKLHISNSVLDNCLSTLKHETMYYPSRIRQLIEGGDEHLQAISELVHYYKELYSLLSAQAMRQVDAVKGRTEALTLADIGLAYTGDVHLLGDCDMLKYLFDILRQQSGEKTLLFNVKERDDNYVTIEVVMPHLNLTDEECVNLFTPSMEHIPFLLCRQIVREHSEQTARRGCGIIAEPRSEGGVSIMVTLSKTNVKQMTEDYE